MSPTCPLCFNNYDHSRHVPLVSTMCGHSLCRLCVNRLYQLDQNNIQAASCPICRRNIKSEVNGGFVVNYALLDQIGQRLTHDAQIEEEKIESDIEEFEGAGEGRWRRCWW